MAILTELSNLLLDDNTYDTPITYLYLSYARWTAASNKIVNGTRLNAMAADEENNNVAAWKEEQFQIASETVIPEGKSPKSGADSDGDGQSTQRFKVAHSSIDAPFLVGGVDVSFQDKGDEAIAVYVILKYDTINSPPEVVYRSHKWYTLSMPYIPSFLAFREIEPLLELISAQIESKPDLKPAVILVDGNGQWHERKAGIATFVGVKTGIPAVGVGKTFYSIDGIMRKDAVLEEIRMAVSSWYKEIGPGWNNINSIRGLIMDTLAIPTSNKSKLSNNDDVSNEASDDVPMDEVFQALHRVANGIAIPMRGGIKNENEILAYALVGHGGNAHTNKNVTNNAQHSPNCNYSASKLPQNCTKKGSKVPIYISVGSGIALKDAVILCSQLSIARIPEPVREADLYGRQIVRENKSTGSYT